MEYARINSDNWEDVGIIYSVLAYQTFPDSTGVKLELEHNGNVTQRTVASHQIEWLASKET